MLRTIPIRSRAAAARIRRPSLRYAGILGALLWLAACDLLGLTVPDRVLLTWFDAKPRGEIGACVFARIKAEFGHGVVERTFPAEGPIHLRFNMGDEHDLRVAVSSVADGRSAVAILSQGPLSRRAVRVGELIAPCLRHEA